MFEDGVSLGEKGRLEYLRAEQRGGMQVRLEDAARGARAGGSLPSPQPQLQPEADARRGQGPQHPSSTAPPFVIPASSLLKSLSRAPSVIRFITLCPLKSVQPTKEI